MFLPLAFWTSAFLLFHIYLGYPLLMWIWTKVRPRPLQRWMHGYSREKRISGKYPLHHVNLAAS